MITGIEASNTYVVRRTDLRRLTFRGAKAAEVVNGLVTNEVLALQPGQGCYGVALTPKGKIVCDLRIFRTDDAVITDVTAEAAQGWAALVKKFVNPRLTQYVDETADTVFFEWYGEHVAETCTALGVPPGPDFSHAGLAIDGQPCSVARLPGLGERIGAVLWCASGIADAIHAALTARGAAWGSPDGLETWRVEAGRPRWGIDMDDTMLAQEANMDDLHAISYAKGCYTGQEFVARLHYRGHVNRYLRGLRLQAAVPRDSVITSTAGAEVGTVRSCVVSPRAGVIALGLVRRELPEGAEVRVRTPDGDIAATLSALPFAR